MIFWGIGPSALQAALLVISLPMFVFAIFQLAHRYDSKALRGSVRTERRRGPRRKKDDVFDLDVEGAYAPGNARLLDVSAWGASIETKVVLQMGQKIRGRLHSPTEGLLLVIGEVVWKREKRDTHEYGISFKQVTRTVDS